MIPLTADTPRMIQIDTSIIYYLDPAGWSKLEIQNDGHKGLLARVFITDEYALALAKYDKTSTEAVICHWRDVVNNPNGKKLGTS